jgi:hypothetical protein
MKCPSVVNVTRILLCAFFIVSTSAYNRTIVLGNRTGEVYSIDGPATVRVSMGECQFSMTIEAGQHMRYNDPDVVLYRATGSLAECKLPHLKQAEMASGYDWWFEEPKDAKISWVGLMCDSVSNFSWSSSTHEEISPQLQSIMDSNSLKCPADFDGKKWVSLHQTDGTRFENIDVSGASGFVIDRFSDKKFRGSRFCFIHGGNVLIGVSGNGTNVRREKNHLLNTLRSIEFEPDALP